jgi:hypothetical protein
MWNIWLVRELIFWGFVAWAVLRSMKDLRESREQIARDESLQAEHRHREIVEHLEKIVEGLEAIEANQ